MARINLVLMARQSKLDLSRRGLLASQERVAEMIRDLIPYDERLSMKPRTAVEIALAQFVERELIATERQITKCLELLDRDPRLSDAAA